MNWPEFVREAQREMMKKGIDPNKVTVCVEVSDSYYDKDVTANDIYCQEYTEGSALIIRGK